MVFSSTTFLFLFLPAVIFFYWLPDVFLKIKSFFCKKLDNQDQNLALYSQTANATPTSDLGFREEGVGNKGEENHHLSLTFENIATPQSPSQTFRTYKNLVLLAFSILFYAWGEPAFVLVMILSIIANYAFGRLIDKFRSKDKV